MPGAATTPARRPRPAFVPTLAAIIGIVLFVAAGNWQHDRMEQKLRLGEQLAKAAATAPAAMPSTADWAAWRFRPVTLEGTFDARHQILLDNKVNRSRVGYDVITPMVLADGRAVLVNRGWVPGGASRSELPAVPPPAGGVRLNGRINAPPAAYLELSHVPPAGAVWQNLDLSRFRQATGLDVLPVVVEQTDAIGPGDTLVRERPAPDVGADKHRIYMMQWYAFAALAAGLWAYFTLRPAR
jgi:surfeit locus 1 family protein